MPRVAISFEIGQGDVLLHVLDEDEAICLAVLRRIRHAVLDGVVRVVVVRGRALHEQLAADPVAVGIAEDAARELGAARAHETGEPDDLSLAHVEGDVLQHAAARSSG